MLQYKAAAIGIAFLVQKAANAFSPIHPTLKKVELARQSAENEYLNMVAGGAAAGKEEYYEGKYISAFIHDSLSLLLLNQSITRSLSSFIIHFLLSFEQIFFNRCSYRTPSRSTLTSST